MRSIVRSEKNQKERIRVRARRMSPAQRREQILDTAVELIVARGLSHCTLEEVAAQASISKPLIYKYFQRRDELLTALLAREYRFLRGRGLDVLPRDLPFAELIQRSSLRSLEYLYERGPIMRLLASDRSVAELARHQDRDERGGITDYFVKRLMRVYDLPKEVATICAVMAVNAPILSARALKSTGIPASRAAEVWSVFMLGGNDAVQAEFAKSTKTKGLARGKANASKVKPSKAKKSR